MNFIRRRMMAAIATAAPMARLSLSSPETPLFAAAIAGRVSSRMAIGGPGE